MEVETLKHRAIRYQPDLVLIHLIKNDLNLPNFILAYNTDPFSLSRSLLWEWIEGRLQRVRRPAVELSPAPRKSRSRKSGAFENDPDRVPEAYRDMVGMQAYTKAMQELLLLSRQHGFESVLVTPVIPRIGGRRIRAAMTFAGELGISIIDLSPCVHVSEKQSFSDTC